MERMTNGKGWKGWTTLSCLLACFFPFAALPFLAQPPPPSSAIENNFDLNLERFIHSPAAAFRKGSEKLTMENKIGTSWGWWWWTRLAPLLSLSIHPPICLPLTSAAQFIEFNYTAYLDIHLSQQSLSLSLSTMEK